MNTKLKNPERIGASAVILLAAVFYALPTVLFHRYLVASTGFDDSLLTWKNILQYNQYFQSDIYALLAEFQVRSSLLHYGSLWLNTVLHVPLLLISQIAVIWVKLAIPFIYILLPAREFSPLRKALLFVLALTAGIAAWNFALFPSNSHTNVPNPSAMALPLLTAGLILCSQQSMTGLLLIAAGSLFHALAGMYAVCVLGIWMIMKKLYRQPYFLIFLGIICAIVLLPKFLTLGIDYPKVNSEELFDSAVRMLKHATPWDAYGWQFLLPVMISFLFLFLFSFRYWNVFGREYLWMLTACAIACTVLSLTQLAGHWLRNPYLVVPMGLRSTVLLSLLAAPVCLAGLIDSLAVGSAARRFAAALIMGILVTAAPYGIYAVPVICFGILLLADELRRKNKTAGNFLETASFAFLLLWCAGQWLDLPVPDLLTRSSEYLKPEKFMWIAGFAAAAAVVPFVFRKKQNASPWVMTLLLFVWIGVQEYRGAMEMKSGWQRDWYDAQVWARENTAPDALFIEERGTWRSFSERSAFSPRPLKLHFYTQDRRFLRFDQWVYDFFGVGEDYKTVDQMPMEYFITNYRTSLMREKQIIEMARAVDGEYYVTDKTLSFPLVYQNPTFRIYALKPGSIPEESPGTPS